MLVVTGWVVIDIKNEALLTIAMSSGCVPIMEFACEWMNEWMNETMTKTATDS